MPQWTTGGLTKHGVYYMFVYTEVVLYIQYSVLYGGAVGREAGR